MANCLQNKIKGALSRGAGLLLAVLAGSALAAEPLPAFPGAQGWAAETPGGRGGRILRVTSLGGDGPGSLREALLAQGPRIVVFEVGGLIDLERQEIVIREPFLTLAGQTAPAPGITLIRGGIDVATHDVVIQHIRVRPGEAGAAKMSGWEVDALSTVGGAWNVIVDHCSFTWATDENLSASGPRFNGATPDDWREHTSHRITFSNNIIAEGLARSTHSKGEHSKGSLIHDNVTDILIVGNLYAHDKERNPLFKGGARGWIVNNLIYDPGERALHYNLIAAEWQDHPYQTGRMVMIGNVVRSGPSTPGDVAFLSVGGSGDLEIYSEGNLGIDRLGKPLAELGRYTTAPIHIVTLPSAPTQPPALKLIGTGEVQDFVIRNAGADPAHRDHTDARIVADTIEARGEIIDSETAVNGYPKIATTQRPFDPKVWDLRFMTPRN